MNPLKNYLLDIGSRKPQTSTNSISPGEENPGRRRGNRSFLSSGSWSAIVLQLINPMFMSAPSLIAKAAIRAIFIGRNLQRSLHQWHRTFLGLSPFGCCCHPFWHLVGWYKKMSYIFDPFVNAMNATPRVALLPLVIIWLGIGILSKVGIIFLGAVFPILINSRDGVKTTPVNLLTAARSFGASEWMIFKSRRASFDYPLHSEWFEARTWEGYRGCYGRRALCGHRRNRFYDHSGRCYLPNR